jgi:pseudouridine-5'-phosphate glycosidase
MKVRQFLGITWCDGSNNDLETRSQGALDRFKLAAVILTHKHTLPRNAAGKAGTVGVVNNTFKSLAVSYAPEVQAALDAGAPVVALESTIISHGLPRPRNFEVALEFEQEVRNAGAVPATIAMVDGVARIGLTESQLSTIANDNSVVKVSIRDLGIVAARKGNGATTVAATAHIAALAGIRVFATGGLGGVHRDAQITWDESADLTAIANTAVTVVCAGVKSILDVNATLERLETLSVPVVAVGTKSFPGFFLSESGFTIDWSVENGAEVAAIMNQRIALGIRGGMIVANPLPLADQLDPILHNQLLHDGLIAANARNIKGKEVTPFLLDYFHRESQGKSLDVNVTVVLKNARLAAQIAAAL